MLSDLSAIQTCLGLTLALCAAEQTIVLMALVVLRCRPAAAEILEGVLPPAFHSRLAYLSGPSFAAEVAQQLPTVVTIAAKVSPQANPSQHTGCTAPQAQVACRVPAAA